MVARSPNGATVTIYPPDAQGRRKMVSRAPSGATVVSYADADDARSGRSHDRDSVIDRIIEMKAVGVTPEYIGGDPGCFARRFAMPTSTMSSRCAPSA